MKDRTLLYKSNIINELFYELIEYITADTLKENLEIIEQMMLGFDLAKIELKKELTEVAKQNS